MANVVRLERCAGMVSDLIPRLRRKLMQALPECGKFMGADSRKLGPTRRINLVKANRRIFPPTPLGTRGWTKGYARRSAVERLNTRLDDGLSFESHTIRGKPKMTARVGLVLGMMMALALSSVKANTHRRMRSLVRAPSFTRLFPLTELTSGPPLVRAAGKRAKPVCKHPETTQKTRRPGSRSLTRLQIKANRPRKRPRTTSTRRKKRPTAQVSRSELAIDIKSI